MNTVTTESKYPPGTTLRKRVLAELREMDLRGFTVVPERSSVPGQREVSGVVVTDNEGGHRFRLLETGELLTLDEDTSPDDVCPTWLRVESAPSPLRTVLEAMVAVMKR